MEVNLFKRFISVFKRRKIPYNKPLIDWASFQKDIYYKVKDKEKFLSALLHSSFSNTTQRNNFESYERLEFLGDAVLNLAIGDLLFRRHPQKSEGELSKIRSVLVSKKVLAKKAQEINLGKHIILGSGEEKTGGREKESILADIFESIIGAIYLERGLDAARKFVEYNIMNEFQAILSGTDVINYKGELIEYCQRNRLKIPKYFVKKQKGADHLKIYTIDVKVGEKFLGRGVGTAKKEAEQKAAEEALKNLKFS
ncbi:ribonuclease III [candidate division KSB1 bacterium]